MEAVDIFISFFELKSDCISSNPNTINNNRERTSQKKKNVENGKYIDNRTDTQRRKGEKIEKFER